MSRFFVSCVFRRMLIHGVILFIHSFDNDAIDDYQKLCRFAAHFISIYHLVENSNCNSVQIGIIDQI